MENRLITMVEFVINTINIKHSSYLEFLNSNMLRIVKYVNFLNTPLNIGMFVPAIEVDGKWEVLKEPEDYQLFLSQIEAKNCMYMNDWYRKCEQYQKAKDKLIFEGVDLKKAKYICKEKYEYRIEDLLYLYVKPTLTPYGMELSGLNR